MDNALKNHVHIIKKYPNRRLYDTYTSAYITLSEIRHLIAYGKAFTVLDSKTNKDLTRSILLQVILEEENGNKPLFSKEILMQIIKFYEHPMQQILQYYLEKNIQLFTDSQKKLAKVISLDPNQEEQLAHFEIPIMENIMSYYLSQNQTLLTQIQMALEKQIEAQTLSVE